MNQLDKSWVSEVGSPTSANQHSLNNQLNELACDYLSGRSLGSDDRSQPSPECEADFSGIQHRTDSNNQDGVQIRLFEPDEECKRHKPAYSQDEGECDSNSSPKTVTLVQQQEYDDNFTGPSKFSQYSTEVDNQSFATFLTIRDSNYATTLASFEGVFSVVSNQHEKRFAQVQETYLRMIKYKLKQEKQYLAAKTGNNKYMANHMLFTRAKDVMQKLSHSIEGQKQVRMPLVERLQAIYEKFQSFMTETGARMKSMKDKIVGIRSQIAIINKQMIQLMMPQQRKANKKHPNMHCSAYVRTKYLMASEKTYLALVGDYLENVILYVRELALQVQPRICQVVKESLVQFAQLYSKHSGAYNQAILKLISALKQNNSYELVYKQIGQALESAIQAHVTPTRLNYHNPATHPQQHVNSLIQCLISETQSLIYIPVIESEPKDVLYCSAPATRVTWTRVMQTSSKQAVEQVQINLIITAEGQLVLEVAGPQAQADSEYKVAVLKLEEVKISRKNNRIVLTDRKEGVLGFIMSTNAVLGHLEFESRSAQQTSEQCIEQFVGRVREYLEARRSRGKQKSQDNA